MSNGGECAARVTVRSAAARSIKSYKGGDAVLSGNKRGEWFTFLGPINSSLQSFTCKTTCLPPPPRNGLVHWSQLYWLVYRGVSIYRNACWTTSHYLYEGQRGHERGIVLLNSFIYSFRFSLPPVFAYENLNTKKIVHSQQTEHCQNWHQWRHFFSDQEIFFQDSTVFVNW